MSDFNAPLAERMRPRQLEDLIGQEHLTGANGILSNALKSGVIPSMILWGPPGVGKTTIAYIIAKLFEEKQGKIQFYTLSAISAGVKEVRDIIQHAKKHQSSSRTRTLLFIDEIHRFNKGQQDALLGAVEKGEIILIGATTENPSFEINSPLLSRCQVYPLKPLGEEDLVNLLKSAIEKDPLLQKKSIELRELNALLQISNGDARKLLNIFELIVNSQDEQAVVDNEKTKVIAQQHVADYDKTGDQHYDIISAFIKSIRGSDPNAAVYYLARMVEGGEDVKFIARRLLIAASEDIGNANPTAMVMANNCFQAVNVIGYPEAEIILSQCTTYLACSPKSNASYNAIKDARKLVKDTGNLPIPYSIRNAPTKLMKEFGYGKGYQYAHDYQNNFVNMEFMPDQIKNLKLYDPGNNPRENEQREWLKKRWKDKYGY